MGEFGNIAGNIIWATDKVEHVNRQTQRAGKGGPKHTTITKTYTVSMAIAFADTLVTGPVAFAQIYRNYTLIFDSTSPDSLPENWTLYTGTATQEPDPTIEATEGVGNVPAYRYLCYLVVADEDLGHGGATPNYTATLNQEGSNELIDVVPMLLETCDLDATLDLDLTELEPEGIQTDVSMAIVARQQVRAIIEHLAQAYRFYVIESGTQLKFRQHESGDRFFDIPEEDTDAAEDRSPGKGTLMTRTDDIALPTEIDLGYIDQGQNYQGNTQRAQRTLAIDGFETRHSMSLPIVLTSGTAKTAVCEILFNTWIGRERLQTTLGRKWAFLEPGDRGYVEVRGTQYAITLTEVTYGRPGLVEITGHATASICAPFIRGLPVAPGSDVVQPEMEPIESAGDTTAHLLNLPALTASDYAPRCHVGYLGDDASWGGAVLYRSTDGEASYQQLDVSFIEAITGTVAAATANASWYVLDTTTTITVVLDKGELESVTDLALYSGANLCSLGDEILAFGVATLTGTLTYELTRLLRGRRGTEWAVSGHGTGERFFLLDIGVRSIPMDLADRHVPRPYKTVTSTQDIADVTSQSFTPTAENLNGWSVAQPDANLSGSDWVLTWRYRSRFAGDWVDTTGIGWDIDHAGFQVDIYSDGTYTTIERSTLTDGGSTIDPEAEMTWTYTAAMQTTDFGSPQATLYYKISQLTNAGISYAESLVGS